MQFRIADYATAARRRAAAAASRGRRGRAKASPRATRLAAEAKRFATDAGFDVVNGCLQLHGGYGYLRDHPIERVLRDLRVHQILEGTNEIMRVIIAREMLGNWSACTPTTPEILFERRGAAGLVTLNRPQALNAVTHGMVLRACARSSMPGRDDPAVTRVIVTARGRARLFRRRRHPRALRSRARRRLRRSAEFWRDEYRSTPRSSTIRSPTSR